MTDKTLASLSFAFALAGTLIATIAALESIDTLEVGIEDGWKEHSFVCFIFSTLALLPGILTTCLFALRVTSQEGLFLRITISVATTFLMNLGSLYSYLEDHADPTIEKNTQMHDRLPVTVLIAMTFHALSYLIAITSQKMYKQREVVRS